MVARQPVLAQFPLDNNRPTNARPVPSLVREPNGSIVVHARRIAEPIKVDGILDEGAYREITPITEFMQQEPTAGAPITEKTEVWVLFDDKNIYISCRCWHEHPEHIVASDMRRDNVNYGAQDHIGVVFDTFHDKRNGFLFNLSPIGAMRDGMTTEDAPGFDWNTAWAGEARRFAGGWIGEMAIPFKSLRYPPGLTQVWGIQIRREIRFKNEHAYLTRVSQAWGPSAIHHVSAAATLLGVEAPAPALNLEVKPYGISRVTTDLLSNPQIRNDLKPDAGVDVKYGVTKRLTADFTYNTDFAQVEADEAQVNLTRFNLSFPEKRDFFLEGQSIFSFGAVQGASADAPAIVYTRRIGLQGSNVVPVIAGGRLTGKAGPWNIGALNIQTESLSSAGVPQTNFAVVRLRRDVLRRSTVGGIFTRRSLASNAPGPNDVLGLDANFRFFQNLLLSGYFARSRTDNQRGDDRSYDVLFNYAGDRYGLVLDRLVTDKNFNADVGFMRRRNFRRNFVQSRFSPRTRNNGVVRKWTYQGSLEAFSDDTGRLQSRYLMGQFLSDFHSSDQMSIQYLRNYEFLAAPFLIAQDVRLPIGGYDFQDVIVAFTAGQQRRMSGTASLDIGTFYSGNKKTAGFKGRVPLTPQLGLEPNISVNWVDLPEGRFTNTVLGGRATFTMTPRMLVAGLVQYASSTSSILTNIRFRWEYQAGSELFVVYTEGRSTVPPSGTDLQNRGFVIKINRLFRF